MRRAPVPYAMAYVTLAEGPRMLTNIVDCDFDKLKIGQAVKVVFKPTDGGPPLPMFTPVDGDVVPACRSCCWVRPGHDAGRGRRSTRPVPGHAVGERLLDDP